MKSILVYLFLVSVCRFDSTETLFVSDHEDLLLVPSLVFPGTGKANDSNDDHWNLQIHSWLFKVNSFRSMLATSILSTMIDDMDSNRISYLTASGRSNKLVCFRSTDTRVCAPTDKKGRLQLQIRFNSEQLNSIRVGRDLDEKFVYSMSTEDKRIQSTGELFLCRNDGISIISDIDDTIKLTGVNNLRLVLRNTFSNRYRSVPGMSERYRHYRTLYNASFHYLTASPDQLYPFLREFIDQESFPSGSFHMRHFTWMDSNFFNFFRSSSFVEQKKSILNMFFRRTTQRKFIFFGDIFQKDPEIYSDIYNRYPQRILKIFIRTSNTSIDDRLSNVFSKIPPSKWSTFTDGFDLPDKIL